MPVQALSLFLYRMHLLRIETAKGICFSVLGFFKDRDALLDDFFSQAKARITPWYLERRREDDVVVSASPAFLVARFCRFLGIRHFLCTEMDIRTGRISGRNCKGKEKVARFLAAFPDGRIDNFYSDSLSDAPLARLAAHAYLVDHKRGCIRPFPIPPRD